MRKLALLLLALLVVPLATATLGGKDYPRPDLVFTVDGGTSTSPGTMTVVADQIPDGDVKNVRSIAQDAYAKGAEFLFQTCYRQGVLEVTYKDTAKGVKTFLVLYCPSNDKIRLSPTTGPSYQVLHRDVQYDYGYTSIASPAAGTPTAPGTTASTTTNPDALLLGMFEYYLNAGNTSVQTIEMKSNEALLLPPQTDPVSGAITSFQAGFVLSGRGTTRYNITSAGPDGIFIQNTVTRTTTVVMPEAEAPLATIAPTYTFQSNSGASSYQLNPRTTALLYTWDTLELVNDQGEPMTTSTKTPGADICDKKFDPADLYLKVDCGAFDNSACDSNTRMKVATVSPATGTDGSEYYTVGYLNPDNAQQFINVYCNAPTSTQQGGAPATSTGTPPATLSASPQCNSVSTLTLPKTSPTCTAGSQCKITFDVKKKNESNPPPDYCLIGFIQSGNLLKDRKGKAMRWIYPCSQLSNKQITVILPGDAQNPKVYLFPIQNNAVTTYLNEHPSIKETFERDTKGDDGYQTPDMLLDRSGTPRDQCTTGNGGNSTIITTHAAAPPGGKPSQAVQTALLGMNPINVDFTKFTDNVFQINDTKGDPSGFVLDNLTAEIAALPPGMSGYLSDYFSKQFTLLNNYPVSETKNWAYANTSPSSSPINILNQVKKFDVYCLRRNITADNTPYNSSLGTCGAYVFFPQGKTGTITIYTKPSVNPNKETVLSLSVTGASRIMTQHLNYNEKPDTLQYGFWTTTIPGNGESVTISLGYPTIPTGGAPVGTDLSHPVYDCAAGNISELSADFRESQDSAISSKLQPTRAFISSNKDFAYCSAAGEINELFPGMTQAYVDGTSFVSNTTLTVNIIESQFQNNNIRELSTNYPFSIQGKNVDGTTKQIFRATDVASNIIHDETFASQITLERPNGAFSQEYTTSYNKDENKFSVKYNQSKFNQLKWTVRLQTKANKFVPGTFDAAYPDGDLRLTFAPEISQTGTAIVSSYLGTYRRVNIITRPTTASPTTTATQPAQQATGRVVALTGFAVQSQTAANGVTTLFESDKPDLSPGRVMAKASQNRQEALDKILRQPLVFAEYVTDKTPDDLNLSTLFGEPVNIMAKTQATLTWKKDVDELGTATYGNTLWDLVEIVYDGQLPNNQNHYILVMKPAGPVPSTTAPSGSAPPAQQPAVPSQAPEDKYCAINIQGDCYSLNVMGCGDCGTKPVQVKDTSGKIIQACRCQLTI